MSQKLFFEATAPIAHNPPCDSHTTWSGYLLKRVIYYEHNNIAMPSELGVTLR